MKPADKVQRLLRRAGVTTSTAPDDAVFENLKTAYLEMRETSPAPQEPAIWRIIMNSPRVKLSMAAVVVLLGALAVSFWQGTGGGIALADVLARMEQVQAYRLRMSTTFRAEGAEDKPMAEATMLISQTLGQKVTIQLDHPLTGQSMLEEIYIQPLPRTVTTLMPTEKKYSKVELDEASIERWQSESNPYRIVERVVQCEHRRLGRSVVDGVEVEGFQTTDPNCLGETSTAGAEIKIWADVETRLPVRIEIDKGEPGKGHMQVVAHSFEWDVPVAATEFEPVIPDDYTPGRPMMQLGPKR
jgi:outer membrane lipoprotein-sorting protein